VAPEATAAESSSIRSTLRQGGNEAAGCRNCGSSNFFDSGDQLNSMAPKVKADPGFHDVWIHGSADGVAPSFNAAEGGANLIDHRGLASMIRNDPSNNGGSIRMSIGAAGAPLGPPYTGGAWPTFSPGGGG
jgi:hypothetical protein